MSSFIAKLVLKRVFRETNLNKFGTEDPYYEEYYLDEDLAKNPRAKPRKRIRPVPECIHEDDKKILLQVRRRAYNLDMKFAWCGVRMGWSGIVGIVPWIGTLIQLYFSFLIFQRSCAIKGYNYQGLPLREKGLMIGNILLDLLIGLIPFAGTILDITYKTNSRNVVILERYLEKVNKINIAVAGSKDSFDYEAVFPPPPEPQNTADSTSAMWSKAAEFLRRR